MLCAFTENVNVKVMGTTASAWKEAYGLIEPDVASTTNYLINVLKSFSLKNFAKFQPTIFFSLQKKISTMHFHDITSWDRSFNADDSWPEESTTAVAGDAAIVEMFGCQVACNQ